MQTAQEIKSDTSIRVDRVQEKDHHVMKKHMAKILENITFLVL